MATTGWSPMPDAVVSRIAEIGAVPFAVYATLKMHADRDGVAWPSVNRICKLVAITRATAYRALRTLKAAGLIAAERQRDEKGRDVSTKYTLPPVGECITRAPPVVSERDGEGVTGETGEGVTRAPRTIPNKNHTQRTSARTQFVQPTLDEVKAYCQERGNKVDPQAWMDHYTANGWRVGRTAMKDWRAAVRTWERNGYSTSGSARRGLPVDDANVHKSDREKKRPF